MGLENLWGILDNLAIPIWVYGLELHMTKIVNMSLADNRGNWCGQATTFPLAETLKRFCIEIRSMPFSGCSISIVYVERKFPVWEPLSIKQGREGLIASRGPMRLLFLCIQPSGRPPQPMEGRRCSLTLPTIAQPMRSPVKRCRRTPSGRWWSLLREFLNGMRAWWPKSPTSGANESSACNDGRHFRKGIQDRNHGRNLPEHYRVKTVSTWQRGLRFQIRPHVQWNQLSRRKRAG